MQESTATDALHRLAIHTITTKPWPIEVAIDKFAAVGAGGISVWREALEGRNIQQVGRQIRDAGLSIVSYVRGGFFPHPSPEQRLKSIDENKRIIEEAAELGAPQVVLVCGAHPELTLHHSRAYIQDAIATLLSDASAAGIQLGIEPLHPVYAGQRSAISTLSQANDMAEKLDSPSVGVVVDVYHLWWDDRLHNEIARCAENDNLIAFHVCDWRVPTRDILNDREIMGEGCIDLAGISRAVAETGYNGFIEVEIFSTEYWAGDQDRYLQKIIEAYLENITI